MKDRVGEKYGRLTVISFDKKVLDKGLKRNYLNYYWNCKCECGNIKSIGYRTLIYGNTKSCGCLNKEGLSNLKHGYAKTNKISPEYNSWYGMIQRCTNINHASYHNYGKKGITVCESWLKFENFIKDMGNKPGKEYSIDRIENDLGYCKENCKWSSRKEQNNNQSSNRKVINIITNEEYTSIADAAESNSMNQGTLYAQLTGINPNTTNLKLKKNETTI